MAPRPVCPRQQVAGAIIMRDRGDRAAGRTITTAYATVVLLLWPYGSTAAASAAAYYSTICL
jgi:hypothetical protein